MNEQAFIDAFKEFQKQMWENSESKGFHQADKDAFSTAAQNQARISQRLMLIVSELAEAMEALRHGNPPDSHIPEFSGMEAELADAIIRITDLAQQQDLRLAEAIVAKAAYNAKREFMHGGKKF